MTSLGGLLGEMELGARWVELNKGPILHPGSPGSVYGLCKPPMFGEGRDQCGLSGPKYHI